MSSVCLSFPKGLAAYQRILRSLANDLCLTIIAMQHTLDDHQSHHRFLLDSAASRPGPRPRRILMRQG